MRSIARLLPRAVLRGSARVAERLPVSDEKIGFEYKVKRFLAGALLPADEAHFFWNGTFSRREQREFFDTDPQPLGALFSKLAGGPDTRSDLNRYLFIDQHCYLPDDILHKCDRMSMAHSIELRPPFLDHRIVEFAGRLPLALKVRGSQTKYILRKLMSGKLPPFACNRGKEGLDIPAHEWLRGPLLPLMHDALSSNSVAEAGLFSPGVIHHLVDRHLSRQANLGYHLWGLLTLHLWIHRWKIETQTASEVERGAVIGSVAG